MSAEAVTLVDRRPPGHVFVVNGSVEHLRAEAVVVPTDRAFTVETSWQATFPGSSPAEVRPVDWQTTRAGQAQRHPGVWFLDVARPTVHEVIAALDALLADIADHLSRHRTDSRARPLIAVPTLGVRHGGFAHERGTLIHALLDSGEAAAHAHGVDIVFVARSRSAFSAFQAVRRTRARNRKDPAAAEGSRQRLLGRYVRENRVALFVGAGVSMSAGLPSWQDLIKDLAAQVGVTGIETLAPLDQAQLLSARSGGGLGTAVADLLRAANPTGRHGVSHALLAGLRCREVVTTNFDLLLEQAVSDVHHARPAVIVPSDDIRPDRPWLLKLHGDVNDPNGIVLTRGDFVRFAGSSAARGAVLQELMLTRHLLVVGASLTDDNVLRLAHEVMQLREHRVTTPIGTVLTLTPDPVRAALFEGEFTFVAVDDGSATDPEAARVLEVELDHIAMYACSDASYLVDRDYDDLLNRAEQRLAQQVRELALQLDALDDRRHLDSWRLLRRSLEEFGAGAGLRVD